MIHYVSGWVLCVFRGDQGNSDDVGRALGMGSEIAARAGVPAHVGHGIHDPKSCARSGGRHGCAYVQGAAPRYTDR